MKQNFVADITASALIRAIIATFTVSVYSLGFSQPDPLWKEHDFGRPRPPIIDPGTSGTLDQPGKPPSDATVLFDGKDLSQWVSLNGNAPKWIVKDGCLECV